MGKAGLSTTELPAATQLLTELPQAVADGHILMMSHISASVKIKLFIQAKSALNMYPDPNELALSGLEMERSER